MLEVIGLICFSFPYHTFGLSIEGGFLFPSAFTPFSNVFRCSRSPREALGALEPPQSPPSFSIRLIESCFDSGRGRMGGGGERELFIKTTQPVSRDDGQCIGKSRTAWESTTR